MRMSTTAFGVISVGTGVAVLLGGTSMSTSEAICGGIPLIVAGAYLLWASSGSTQGKLSSIPLVNTLVWLGIFCVGFFLLSFTIGAH